MKQANLISTGLSFVNVHGKPIDIEQLAQAVKPKPKAVADKPAEFFKGFRVEGHPPGALEAAKAYADKLVAQWAAMTDSEKKAERSKGFRTPKEFDEAMWRTNTKMKPVRAKPYDLKEAADQCAEMARKAGWIDVRVVAIEKRAA